MPHWMLDPVLEPPCTYHELPELCRGSRGFGQPFTPLDELDQDSCLAPWFVLGWSWTWCCSLSAVAQSGHDWSVLLHGTIPRTLLQFLILLPHSSAGEYMPYSSLVFNPLPAPLHPPALSCPSPALPNSLLTSQTPHV